MNSFSPNVLNKLQQLVQQSLQTRNIQPRRRQPGAWAAWNMYCPKAHALEYEAFKASSATKQGITPLFCNQWRKDHPEEYAAFEAAYKEKYSFAAAPAEASPASDAAAGAPIFSRKPLSQEHKDAMQAVRHNKKTEKEVAVGALSANAAEADTEQIELLPFKLGGRSFLRPGTISINGSRSWITGNLWESKRGIKGDWVGVLQKDGTIDSNEDEPEIDFNENDPELKSKIVSVSSAFPSAVASSAAGADAPPVLAAAFTKQYALVEERKGDFERVIMTKMAEGWELQGGVSFLPSGRYLQAMHRDIRKRNNLGGSLGGRRKLTRKLRRY